MEGLRNGMSVQYSVKQKVTEAVEERTGSKRRRGCDIGGRGPGRMVAILGVGESKDKYDQE